MTRKVFDATFLCVEAWPSKLEPVVIFAEFMGEGDFDPATFIDAFADPPIDHVIQRLAHLRVFPVQVRLFFGE
jgi:hypothetical protein